MKTIVVGYDSSDAAERALARGAEIAEAFSARLVVVSVSGSALAARAVPEPIGDIPTPAAASPFGPTMVAPELAVEGPALEEAAQRQLERARRSLAGREIETEYVAELGDPADRLLDAAQKHDADLIVVGTREHGFLERLLGPPVEEAVARSFERDVLLVH
jgi:nucleotide-binding universal stress UspA family protein